MRYRASGFREWGRGSGGIGNRIWVYLIRLRNAIFLFKKLCDRPKIRSSFFLSLELLGNRVLQKYTDVLTPDRWLL